MTYEVKTHQSPKKYTLPPGFPHHREFEGDQFWPPTPPPPIEDQNTPEKSELVDRGTSALRSPNEATEAEEESSEMQQKDEFFNSEMELPKEMTIRKESTSEDVMQPRGQRPTASAMTTTSCLLNEVSEGIYVGETPLPMEEEDDEQGYLEDVRGQMWKEAVRDLQQDNRRQLLRIEEKKGPDKWDLSNVMCLWPCCCCCFCLCHRKRK